MHGPRSSRGVGGINHRSHAPDPIAAPLATTVPRKKKATSLVWLTRGPRVSSPFALPRASLRCYVRVPRPALFSFPFRHTGNVLDHRQVLLLFATRSRHSWTGHVAPCTGALLPCCTYSGGRHGRLYRCCRRSSSLSRMNAYSSVTEQCPLTRTVQQLALFDRDHRTTGSNRNGSSRNGCWLRDDAARVKFARKPAVLPVSSNSKNHGRGVASGAGLKRHGALLYVAAVQWQLREACADPTAEGPTQ
jgi:hypothetical protein